MEVNVVTLKLDDNDMVFDITNFGYLSASNMFKYLLNHYDCITKKCDNVVESLENLLVNGKEIKQAFYNAKDNTVILYF